MSGRGISFRDVSVSRGGIDRVQRIDLDVAAGEWVGLIGPNGAGKSTVLGAAAGVVEYRGAIESDGDDLAAMSPGSRARTVSLVPQRPVIPPGVG